jgi:CDP-glycerol glycerophosphotransferase
LHYKKKSCRFLNTWHGAPIKRGGNDCGGRKDFDFRAVDFFCYASDFEKGTEQRSFRVREEAQIPTGLPRNDELYRVTQEEIISIKKKLDLPLDKKVIIYAPTWRDSNDGGVSYEIKPPVDIKKWEASLSEDYVLAMRTHQYTNKLLGIEFDDFCRDFCTYPNVNDLLKVADLMISDYSAIMADYSILERPILCFAYDYEWFRDTRGLYLDYTKEMPSGILRSEDEVLSYIKSMDFEKESIKTKQLLKNKLAQYGGHATETCLDLLFEK